MDPRTNTTGQFEESWDFMVEI